ncbi:hypothetical protein BDF22DRAFT_730941 [Syncephalis plumigaleata]|nr:hypothetical protein BDF22DRAFT_730941 [Syncephalis plumigaleata]
MRPTLVYALTIVLAAVALTGDVASAAPRIGQFGNRQPPCYRPSDVSTPTATSPSDAATPTPTDSLPSSSDDAATSTQTETPTIPTNTPSPGGFVRPPASGSINLPNHVSS